MKRIHLFVTALLLAGLASFVAAPLTASAAPAPAANDHGCAQFYTVNRGDHLVRIAGRFRSTVAALASLNGLTNPDRIFSGQVLCVRGAAPETFDDGFFYRVRPGETLRILGARFGWSFWFLARVNHIADVNRIFAGQELFIPGH
jgi:LysM repeat protein